MAVGVKVKVDVNLDPTRADLSQKQKRGQYALANQMAQDMNRYVPKLNHDLANSQAIGANGKTITWNTVYARAQFYGTNGIAVFRKYTHPGTGSRWDLKAQGIHMAEWVRVTGRAML